MVVPLLLELTVLAGLWLVWNEDRRLWPLGRSIAGRGALSVAVPAPAVDEDSDSDSDGA
jgi:hypothetical protein